MSGVATAIVGTTLVSGYLSGEAAKDQAQAAADAQAQSLGYQSAAEQRAADEQRRQFDLAREDTATQRRVGDQALNYLSGALQPGGEYAPSKFEMGDFTTDPGYQFRLEQGATARTNALGASGMKLSGRAQKELERYGQDYGSAEYANVYNRSMGEYQQGEADKQNYLSNQFQLAGYGASGINTATSAGTNAANTISANAINTGTNQANIATNYGTNMANITGNQYGNLSQGISSGINNYLAYNQNQQMMDMFNNSAYGSGVAGDAYYPAYAPR